MQAPWLPPVPTRAGQRVGPAPARRPRSLLPQVDDLKATLAVQEAELKLKNENADKLIQVVGVETEKVSKEKAIADQEEVKVEIINKVGAAGQRGGSWGPDRTTDAESLETRPRKELPMQGTAGGSSARGSWPRGGLLETRLPHS